MVFWVLSAVLTFAVTALVLVPIVKNRKDAVNHAAFDREIYTARLAEIDHDLNIGRLSRDEAEAAKAEEGRRLLKASKLEQKAEPTRRGPRRPILVWSLLAFIPAATLSLYIANGSPSAGDQPLAARQTANPQTLALETLLKQAEVQLAKNPDDGRGWDVVAPVYMRLGRYPDAIVAYKNSIRVNGPTQERVTSLAEAIVTNDQGLVNAEARKLFEQAAANRPNDPKPRFFLAIAYGQEGKSKKAIEAWRELLKDAPRSANWVQVALAQLNQQLAKEGLPAEGLAQPPEAPGGPTQEDVANAAQLSAEDRKAMIEGMVESLASKLEDEPNNEAGWRRLIRSYMVLGRKEDAMKSIGQARKALAGNEAFLSFLDETEQNLAKTGPSE